MVKLRDKVTGEIVEIPDAPGVRPIGPSDPKVPLQVQGAQLGNQRTRQEIDQAAALLPYRQRVMAAQATKAETDAQTAKANLGKVKAPDPKMQQRLANLRALEQQIARVGQLYQQGPAQTSGLSGLLDYLPTNANRQFDAAGAGLSEMGLAAFRVPGVGSQSDAELRAFVEANRPSAADRDAQIEEKMRNLQTRLGAAYQSMNIPYRPRSFKKKTVAPSDDGWKVEEVK